MRLKNTVVVISQMQIIPFFFDSLSPNFMRFLLGFSEANACVEMMSCA